MFRTFVSVLLLISLVAGQAETIDTGLEKSIDHFFALWTKPCSEWVQVFTGDSRWFHPKFPEGIESYQLLNFCEQNQRVRPALFRQDGQIRLTTSGNDTMSRPLYHVMVPYLYGQQENGNNQSLFLNSGYEYIQLIVDENKEYRINKVVEFFNRASIPFVWPENN